jgi:UbiD family decarboxylase
MAAISANSDIKIAVVVDDDIDIYDEQQVLWAIATHFEADQGLAVIPNAMGAHLNPAAYGEIRTEKGPMNTKMVIDATRPATLPFSDRIRPHQETWDRIKLEDYIDG